MMRLTFILILTFLLLTACTVGAPAGENGDGAAQPTGAPPPDQSMEPGKPATTEPADSAQNPFAPQAGDESMSKGNVYLESTDLLILESYPIQVNLFLSGNLPTPCHDLRVLVNEPDEENRIQIEVYSISDPNAICIQVLEPFDATVSLGSFSTGHYTVYVNGEQVGEFDS